MANRNDAEEKKWPMRRRPGALYVAGHLPIYSPFAAGYMYGGGGGGGGGSTVRILMRRVAYCGRYPCTRPAKHTTLVGVAPNPEFSLDSAAVVAELVPAIKDTSCNGKRV